MMRIDPCKICILEDCTVCPHEEEALSLIASVISQEALEETLELLGITHTEA